MALTDQRLLGLQWRRRRGQRQSFHFINVPLDHLVVWEEVKTLRMRWYRARRIHPFVRVEVEHPDVVVGFAVPNPQAWIINLDRLAGRNR